MEGLHIGRCEVDIHLTTVTGDCFESDQDFCRIVLRTVVEVGDFGHGVTRGVASVGTVDNGSEDETSSGRNGQEGTTGHFDSSRLGYRDAGPP